MATITICKHGKGKTTGNVIIEVCTCTNMQISIFGLCSEDTTLSLHPGVFLICHAPFSSCCALMKPHPLSILWVLTRPILPSVLFVLNRPLPLSVLFVLNRPLPLSALGVLTTPLPFFYIIPFFYLNTFTRKTWIPQVYIAPPSPVCHFCLLLILPYYFKNPFIDGPAKKPVIWETFHIDRAILHWHTSFSRWVEDEIVFYVYEDKEFTPSFRIHFFINFDLHNENE